MQTWTSPIFAFDGHPAFVVAAIHELVSPAAIWLCVRDADGVWVSDQVRLSTADAPPALLSAVVDGALRSWALDVDTESDLRVGTLTETVAALLALWAPDLRPVPAEDRFVDQLSTELGWATESDLSTTAPE